MCRGFQPVDQTERLFKLKSFHVKLSYSKPPAGYSSLPDSLTLHYLPRITGGPLEVNGSVIRPDAAVFMTLHRVVSGDGEVVYGSRERVRVSEGVKFEVYVKEDKVVKGGFRRDGSGEWRMECRCGLEGGGGGGGGGGGVKAVEVVVVAAEEDKVVMREKVEMVVRRRKRRCFEGLEEIPEQESEEEEVVVECGCSDCAGGGEAVEDGGDAVEDGGCEVEGVGWAVDVGIWVVCLGVGYLVSKASSKSVRRRRLL
ncbi:uncharacterized protein LOC143531286 [Bidens hawaiensis]|uniref:uncharacterized protein LOC143531286 n=1 Tax=Bidens hawaiensis TaxID=980011 RepID=UPI00404B81E7